MHVQLAFRVEHEVCEPTARKILHQEEQQVLIELKRVGHLSDALVNAVQEQLEDGTSLVIFPTVRYSFDAA